MTGSEKIHQMKTLGVIFLLAEFSFFFVKADRAAAQNKVTSALIKPDTTEIQNPASDSLGIRAGKIKLISDVNAKSGSLAMLMSAVVPGAGQLYAHRYYTIPIWWGFGIYFSSIAIKANNQYIDFRGKFSAAIKLDSIAQTGTYNDYESWLKKTRDIYHDQRDEFILYLGLTYFLNIIDAYVGATLYDFDVSDQLGGSAKLQVRVPLR